MFYVHNILGTQIFLPSFYTGIYIRKFKLEILASSPAKQICPLILSLPLQQQVLTVLWLLSGIGGH